MARVTLAAACGVWLAVLNCESTVVVQSTDAVVAAPSVSASCSSVAVGSGGGGLGGEGGACACAIRECQGHLYDCGDCVDNDLDGLVDSADPECTGACDSTEDTFYSLPIDSLPCSVDCYFDQDNGAGNDDCHWNHRCDPHEVPPHYYPNTMEGAYCAYDPSANLPDTNKSCDELYAMQSLECHDYYMPLVPNGCDCFGCCELPAGSDNWVYLGSFGTQEIVYCTLEWTNYPSICQPCMPVPSCLNDCETCELCIGKSTLPPECAEPSCPSDRQRCAEGCEPRCPEGQYCVTGCCAPVPR